MAYAEKSEFIGKAVVAPHAFWLMQVSYSLNNDIYVNPERESPTALGTNTLPQEGSLSRQFPLGEHVSLHAC